MKKLLTILSVAAVCVLLSNCDPSKKGAWSEAAKSEYKAGCLEGAKDVKDFSAAQMNQLCECSLKKLEAQAAPKDLKDAMAEKAGEDCAKEILKANDDEGEEEGDDSQ